MENEKNIKGWLVVLTCFLLMFFIFTTSISCMGVYIKPVSEALGITRTAFSMTITIGSFAMMISAVFAGKLMAKVNIKYLMLIGVAMSAGSMFIYSFAQRIELFYFSAVLMGCAVSLTCNIPVSVLIKEWFAGKSEGFALSIAFVGSGAGAMVLTPLYSHIVENIGWRYSFRFAALCMVIILIPAVILFIRQNTKEKIHTETSMDSRKLMLADMLKMPATWFVIMGFVIISLANMVILNQGIPYWTDNGLTLADAAKLISIASGLLIIGKLMVGKLIDKTGARIAAIICSFALSVSAASLWLIGVKYNIVFVIIFIAGYAIGAAAATVVMPTVISYMYGNCDFGAIMGIFSMTGGAGGMIQVIFSAIYESTENYSYAWGMVIGLCIIMIVLMSLFVKPQNRRKSISAKI